MKKTHDMSEFQVWDEGMFNFKSKKCAAKEKCSKNKALHVIISALLIFTILAATVFVVYFWGVPQVQRTRDVVTFEAMKASMHSIDNAIRAVAHEGSEAKRVINVHISEGRLQVNESAEVLLYEFESSAKVVEPNATVGEGYLIIEGNASARGLYTSRLKLNYSNAAIDIVGNTSIGKGYYNISIRNLGYNTTTAKSMVEVVL